MNLDILEKDKDLFQYSSILSSLDKALSNLYLSSSEYKDSTQVKSLLRQWYMKGYLKALDDYKRMAGAS